MTGKSTRFSAVVVAPTHNNARTLREIVTRITRVGLPVIIVNDGSTDATAEILREFGGCGATRVVTHDRNRGKAAALRSGFDAAAELGFSHAITIDTDG